MFHMSSPRVKYRAGQRTRQYSADIRRLQFEGKVQIPLSACYPPVQCVLLQKSDELSADSPRRGAVEENGIPATASGWCSR